VSSLRNLVGRTSALALLLGVLAVLWPAPAQALIPGVTVDDFNGNTLGTRQVAIGAGGGTSNIAGGVASVTLPAANNASVSYTYTFASPVDLTKGGSADVFELVFPTASTTNPSNAVAGVSVTAVDSSGTSDIASTGLQEGSNIVINFGLGGSGSATLGDGVDLGHIKSVTVLLLPGITNQPYAQSLTLDTLWTVNFAQFAPQRITFQSTPPNPAPVGGHYDVVATGGPSGQPVVLTKSGSACSLAGTTVSFLAAGQCVIHANQAGDGVTYLAAPEETQTITVGKLSQTIGFTSSPPGSPVVGGTYTPTTTSGGSGNPVTLSIGAASTAGACTLSSGTFTFAHVGTCVVAADQAGNGTYDPAPTITQSISIGKANQTITITSSGNPAGIGEARGLTATGGGSGNAVTFSLGAGTTNDACTVAGTTVSFAHAGTCVVAADQAGNADYNAASQKTQSITVSKTSQQITFTSAPPASGAIGGSYTVAATGGSSGNSVSFSVGDGTTNSACTVAGSTVSFAHAGTCVVAADQAGNGDFAAAQQQTQSIPVAKTAQVIGFTTTAPGPASIGGTYEVGASGGSSGNPVTFSVGPGTTNSACTVAGSTVSFAHAGTCVVAADQAGNADFTAAQQQTQAITVGKTAQMITFTSAVPSPAFVGTGYTVTALGGGSGSPVTFSTASAGCTVVGSTVTFVAAGSCNIDAHQAGTADFADAPQVTQLVSVTKVSSSVVVQMTPSTVVHGQAATAEATVTPALGAATGTVQFSVDGTDLGAPVQVVAGAASIPLPADLTAGSRSIGATFTPTDTTTFATEAGAETLTVTKATTSATARVTPNALKATVTSLPPGAGVPTGTVIFTVAGTVVGSASLDGTGAAALTYTLPTGHPSTVAAAYAGDENFLASSASTSRTDPRITASVVGRPKASKAHWYRGTVTVSFACAASASPLTTECPAPVVLKANGADQDVTRTVMSEDGGIGTATAGGINIDHTKPRVKITGVGATGRAPRAPTARCKAVDKLSGVKSCRLHEHRLSGHRIRYTAVATDKAGNRSRRSVTVGLTVAKPVSILGLASHGGTYDVSLGHSYTLVVVGGPRPRYVDAAVAPRQPSGLDAFFRRDGTVNGKPRWVLGVTITSDMGHSTVWNLGVLQGGHLHVVKVRVS
jgi:hypothetical protein